MDTLNRALLVLHFLGLAMGLSVTFGNIVMQGLIARAAPNERAILGRFPLAISGTGRAGLALMWATGLTLAFTKWNGIASMPGTFHVKLTAVVLLTLVVVYLTTLEGQVRRGDMAALARIQKLAPLAPVFALIAIIFAVITFD
jgi:hypothetical protein